GAEQPEHLAGTDIERHTRKRLPGAVVLHDVHDFQHRPGGYDHVTKIRSRISVSSASLVRENDGMPVEKWTPERRKQRTREALLDAAAMVFAKRGFQGASLDEIAETAGYTRGAIYKHFADKEQLLHEVCARLNERTFAEFDELPDADKPLD